MGRPYGTPFSLLEGEFQHSSRSGSGVGSPPDKERSNVPPCFGEVILEGVSIDFFIGRLSYSLSYWTF